jgi:beta-fructofuranosidase
LNADGELLQTPAPELAKLRGITFERADLRLTNSTNAFGPAGGDAIELHLEIEHGPASTVRLLVRRSTDGAESLPISYDGAQMDVAGVKAPFRLADSESLKLRVFVDKSVLEVYANDRACFSRVIPANPDNVDVALEVNGSATLKLLQAWRLKSIW